MLRYVDANLGALIKAGFSYPQADYAWNAIDNHLYGFVLQEENFPLKPEEYSLAAKKAYIPHLEDMGLPNLLAMTNLVAEKRYTGLHEFSFGLDLLITGLETLLHKEMTSSANLPGVSTMNHHICLLGQLAPPVASSCNNSCKEIALLRRLSVTKHHLTNQCAGTRKSLSLKLKSRISPSMN